MPSYLKEKNRLAISLNCNEIFSVNVPRRITVNSLTEVVVDSLAISGLLFSIKCRTISFHNKALRSVMIYEWIM
jgi:hypothetical protein